jgi:hypothetical protein
VSVIRYPQPLVSGDPDHYADGAWENILSGTHPDSPQTSRQADSQGNRPAPAEIVVYAKCCRIGGTLTLDDLAETSEIGDWKMSQFKLACTYAASQGWLIVEDDTLTLTTAGLAAA